MTVIFIIYSFVGGLEAAAWTDFFQGFLIIILSFMNWRSSSCSGSVGYSSPG
jgi:Na+/proline symporter